jgi:hypothetical protein
MDFISSLAATAAGSTSQRHSANHKGFGKENGKDNPARFDEPTHRHRLGGQ